MVIAPGVVRASAVTRHRIVSGWLLQVVSVQIHSFKQNPKKKKKEHGILSLHYFPGATMARVSRPVLMCGSPGCHEPENGSQKGREAGGQGGREARQTFNTKLDVLVICGRSCVASVRPGQLKPAVDRTCNVTLIWRNKKNKAKLINSGSCGFRTIGFHWRCECRDSCRDSNSDRNRI